MVVVFSPDGQFLATTSNDYTARLWDAASGQEVARFPHEGTVWDVVFTRDGQRLATASADKTAQIWIWQTKDLITKLANAYHVISPTLSGASIWTMNHIGLLVRN